MQHLFFRGLKGVEGWVRCSLEVNEFVSWPSLKVLWNIVYYCSRFSAIQAGSHEWIDLQDALVPIWTFRGLIIFGFSTVRPLQKCECIICKFDRSKFKSQFAVEKTIQKFQSSTKPWWVASYVICADHAKLHELIIVVFDYSNKPFNV
jgi:hypothetical protein